MFYITEVVLLANNDGVDQHMLLCSLFSIIIVSCLHIILLKNRSDDIVFYLAEDKCCTSDKQS